MKNVRKLSKKGDKMKPNWTGPYEVVEQVGKTNYRLKSKGTSQSLKTLFNSTRLKHYHERAGKNIETAIYSCWEMNSLQLF